MINSDDELEKFAREEFEEELLSESRVKRDFTYLVSTFPTYSLEAHIKTMRKHYGHACVYDDIEQIYIFADRTIVRNDHGGYFTVGDLPAAHH